jgi:molecular chaperone Hsp33
VVAVQPLPFAEEKTLEKVAQLDLGGLLAGLKTQSLAELVKSNFDIEQAVWDEREARYTCNCSREYLAQVLVSVGEEQMRQIIREDGSLKVYCHYCNTDYEFTDKDADNIFKK